MGRRLTFCPELYLGEGINKKKLDNIKKKLINKPYLANVFLITLANNPSEQLEFFDARQLVQRYYEKHQTVVVGIARDYNEALDIIEQITQECLDKRGDCKLKEYLTC